MMNDFLFFLSHLSGDEVGSKLLCEPYRFLSHLSGDEENRVCLKLSGIFLSHLSGDEAM